MNAPMSPMSLCVRKNRHGFGKHLRVFSKQ
jgi:hypothetical protein